MVTQQRINYCREHSKQMGSAERTVDQLERKEPERQRRLAETHSQ